MANQRLYGDEETTKVNFWMLKRHYDELKRLAELEGKSVAALLRELIAGFLRDENNDGAGPTSRRK
jgi:hypothetical protein